MTRYGSDPRRIARAFARVVAILPIAAAPALAPDHPSRMARGLDLFRGGVRALLVEHCLKCHGGAATKGEFDLATHEGLLRDGAGEGPAIIPGDARASRLYRIVAHLEAPSMPDQAPRPPDDAIGRLAEWIDAGAPLGSAVDRADRLALARPPAPDELADDLAAGRAPAPDHHPEPPGPTG